MATYVVMEPPGTEGTDAAAMRAVFVRDGFHVLAFIIPLVWLLWHRLWIAGLLVFAAGFALMALGETSGFAMLGAALTFLMSIYVGLEGAVLRIAALRRRGWQEWGVVEAGNLAEAEIRYLAGGEVFDTPEPPRPAAPVKATVRPRATPALGLLGYPGKH